MKTHPPLLPAGAESSLVKTARGRYRLSKVLGRWWWLALLLVVLATALFAMIPTWMDVPGPQYESTALVEVYPGGAMPKNTQHEAVRSGGNERGAFSDHEANPDDHGYSADSRFVATQREVIRSGSVLKLALESEVLNDLLGGGDDARKRLKKMIRVRSRRGTDLLEISCRDENRDVAYFSTVAVYKAYEQKLGQRELAQRKEQHDALKQDLENKQQKVKLLRQAIVEAAESSGALHLGLDDLSQPVSDSLVMEAQQELYAAQRELDDLQTRLKQWDILSGVDLVSAVVDTGGMDLKKSHTELEQAKDELDAVLASGLGAKHPEVQLRRGRVAELEALLERRAEAVRTSERHRLTLLTKRVAKMKQVFDTLRENGPERARDTQEFMLARKAYQRAVQIRDRVELECDREAVRLKLPTTRMVVHQEPERAETTRGKGRGFFTLLAGAMAFPFTCLAGLVGSYLAEALFPRKAEAS